MSCIVFNPGRNLRRAPLALLFAGLLAASAGLRAQTPTTPGSNAGGTIIDRVVAVVNDDLVLESDVDEERRFSSFEPYGDRPQSFSRDQAVERLIDRTLILQQAKLQPDDAVTSLEVKEQLQQLRRDIPACKQFHCETDDGWAKFVAAQGFTLAEVEQRWQQRMQTLKFVEVRFRMGIRITPEEIKTYYDKSFVPGYMKQNAVPPKLEAVSERIQEVLLEQRVTALLDDWLKTLRAQGSVRVIRADEVTP